MPDLTPEDEPQMYIHAQRTGGNTTLTFKSRGIRAEICWPRAVDPELLTDFIGALPEATAAAMQILVEAARAEVAARDDV